MRITNTDDRYSTECVATHHGQQMSAISAAVLAEVHSECCDYDVIGIDEGQFFPDIVEFSEEMANRGKMVVIAALDGTFERLPFPNRVLDLIAQAEHVVKLQAVCSECGASAPFSKRISAETNVQLIGGADKYVAVCRRCYHNGPPKTRDVPEHSPIALKASNAPRAW